MRWLAWLFSLMNTVALAAALAAPLMPLTGIPVIPDGSDVKVVDSSGQAVYATGTVKNRVLAMDVTGGKLPKNEKVHVWIGIPRANALTERDIKNVTATTSNSGADIYIGEGKDRVSLTQLLKEVYGIRLEFR